MSTHGKRKLSALYVGVSVGLAAFAEIANAAEVGPPMFDIARQCDAGTHGPTAMSECVVAESEARAELLTNWSKYSNADAARCIKAARKVKRAPYAGLVKCLAPAPATTAVPAQKPAGAATAPR